MNLDETKKVILFGNGQIASAAYWYLTHDSPYRVVAFTVDRDYLTERRLFGVPVIPFESVQDSYPPDHHQMFVSVSFRSVNALRAAKYQQAKEKGYSLISYISSGASNWSDQTPGENCYVRQRAVIEPFVKIGINVTIGSNSTVGHHGQIKDHCYVAAGAVIAGSVTIEPFCFIGANASIRDGITIGEGSVIGAGAVILEDVKKRSVYKGHSATRLPIDSADLTEI